MSQFNALAFPSAGLKPHSGKARFQQAENRLPLAVASLRSAGQVA